MKYPPELSQDTETFVKLIWKQNEYASQIPKDGNIANILFIYEEHYSCRTDLHIQNVRCCRHWSRCILVHWCRFILMHWCRCILVHWCRCILVHWCRCILVHWCRCILVHCSESGRLYHLQHVRFIHLAGIGTCRHAMRKEIKTALVTLHLIITYLGNVCLKSLLLL